MKIRALLLLLALAAPLALAQSQPYNEMRKPFKLAVPDGQVRAWSMLIEAESHNQAKMAESRRILNEAGFTTKMELLAVTGLRKPLYQLTASRDYLEPDPHTNVLLDQIKALVGVGSVRFVWDVKPKTVPAPPPPQE